MRLFFYGTLIAGSGNFMAKAAHARLGQGAAAVVRGWLHAIPDVAGWYPALIPDAAGPWVHGFVYETQANFGARELARIDAYEGWLTQDPAASEYRRQSLAVTLASGECCDAEVYVYNRQLPAHAEPIVDGRFAAFIAARGLRAYGCDG